jgi:quercetin dioxygenase-like cupin family protein
MAETATHYRWDELPREELNPLIGRRLITGEQMMISHVYLSEGAIVPKHSHHNEQITYVLEGRLRFFLGDGETHVIDVAAGEVLTIPPHLPHRAEALEDTLDVDVFTPPREDWLAGTDSYLRRPAAEE